ncbi:hypothetical protein BTVI_04251 [Pitangus sulphuratus]|nr:hypothetical protein BTVI_04251 [Pitangus sulphuratus]
MELMKGLAMWMMDQGGLSALRWRTMTARLINSQSTLKLCGYLLLQLNPYESTGPDGIHSRILKLMADIIAKSLQRGLS